MKRAFCTLAVASGLLVGACKGKESAPAPAAAQVGAEVEAKVLAQVGDRTITVGDFLEALASLDPIDRARYESPARRKELLDALIETELRAIHRGVPKPEAIDAAEVRAYYDAHLASYSEPERRRLQAIVVPSEAEAKKAVAQLGAEPSAVRFGEVVKARSQDASAKTGAPLDLLGDVGCVSAPGDDRGTNARIPDEVRRAAHALKGVGAVSEPIKAGAALWIVRVTSLSAARARTFEEVEKTIRVALAQEKRQAAEKAKLLELAKEANVAIDPAGLEAAFEAGAAP